MSPPPTLHRLTLRFADESLERAYRAAEDPKSLRIIRVALLGAAGMFVLAGVTIHFVPAAWLGTFTIADLWIAWGHYIAITLVLYAVTYFPGVGRRPQIALAALSAVMGAVLVWWLRPLPHEFVTQRGFMFLVLHIFTIYSLLRLRLLPALAAGWGSEFLYLSGMWAWSVTDALSLARQAFWLSACNLWGTLICYQVESALRREFVAGGERDRERARAEGLLLNILPAQIAQRLKASHQTIAEHSDSVTVLFADIVGFTPMSARKSPAELVALLDRVFTGFDQLAHQHGLEKIKTIGDAYMAVAGLPQPVPDHALRAAHMAVAMLQAVRLAAAETGEALQLRVGLHTGPVVAGVIGRSKFSYDLWGDTVNTASRMESLGVPDRVHCTPDTAAFLRGVFDLQPRGTIEVKGKGAMQTFLVAAPAAGL